MGGKVEGDIDTAKLEKGRERKGRETATARVTDAGTDLERLQSQRRGQIERWRSGLGGIYRRRRRRKRGRWRQCGIQCGIQCRRGRWIRRGEGRRDIAR